jgi:hypothetical protein
VAADTEFGPSAGGGQRPREAHEHRPRRDCVLQFWRRGLRVSSPVPLPVRARASVCARLDCIAKFGGGACPSRACQWMGRCARVGLLCRHCKAEEGAGRGACCEGKMGGVCACVSVRVCVVGVGVGVDTGRTGQRNVWREKAEDSFKRSVGPHSIRKIFTHADAHACTSQISCLFLPLTLLSFPHRAQDLWPPGPSFARPGGESS